MPVLNRKFGLIFAVNLGGFLGGKKKVEILILYFVFLFFKKKKKKNKIRLPRLKSSLYFLLTINVKLFALKVNGSFCNDDFLSLNVLK